MCTSREQGYPQDPDPKHQGDSDLLLHLHLERPHLRGRHVKHPKIQGNIEGRVRPREGINVEAAAGVLAMPGLPEELQGLALQEVRHDKTADEEQVENLSEPYDAAEFRVGKEPQVQEQDRRLDQPERQRVEHLEDENHLEELCDLPGLEGPDVPAHAIAFLEDTSSKKAAGEELLEGGDCQRKSLHTWVF